MSQISSFDKNYPLVLHIPDTMATWPWPRDINPHYQEVKAATLEWFHSFHAFNPRAQHAFDIGNFGLLTALTSPHLSKVHLRTSCDLNHLLFLIDEYTDVESESVVRDMTAMVLDALKDPYKCWQR
ncbi:hypothetical protein EIP91_005315 [Steccherinum ochraceum]|uniref:Uncharacterized protein n=1 Tax=Steccherinum ochraceum TaxID=92696 RepID=A0A4R0RMI4_9APHY|nr:hypothetical protein EIP91_005315 [Steccherinum ochraceum]